MYILVGITQLIISTDIILENLLEIQFIIGLD
jgi:hypothetical protein